MFLPILAAGAAVYAVYKLFNKDADKPAGMLGADNDPAFAAHPPGCTGKPRVKTTTSLDGSVWRVSSYRCAGQPYTHYAVAQESGSGKWIGFTVNSRGKRVFWRADANSARDLTRMCLALGVERE